MLLALILAAGIPAQSLAAQGDSVQKIKEFHNLYQYKHFYISAQPTLEALRWLQQEGVQEVINLRSGKERKDYEEMAYDEARLTAELGMSYDTVPISWPEDYKPAKLRKVSDLLAGKEKVMIHCTSGGRASQFFVAYLIQEEGYSVDDAMAVGRKMRFSSPLEKLLGKTLTCQIQ